MKQEDYKSGEISLSESQNEAREEIDEAKERGAYLQNNLNPPSEPPKVKKFNLEIKSEKINMKISDIHAQIINSFIDQALTQVLYGSLNDTERFRIEITASDTP